MAEKGSQEAEESIEKPGMDRVKSMWIVKLEERATDVPVASQCKSRAAQISNCLLVFLMAFAYLALFSRMDFKLIPENSFSSFIGFGAEVFIILREFSEFSYYTGAFGTIGILTLLVLDVQMWTGWLAIVGIVLMFICIAALLVTALLVSESFVSLPFGVFFIVSTMVVVGIRKTIFRDVDASWITSGLGFGLIISCILMLVAWVYWIVGEGNEWEVPLKLTFYEALECPINGQNFTSIEQLKAANLTEQTAFFDDSNNVVQCEFAFFMWASPFVYVGISLIMAIVLRFISKAQHEVEQNIKKGIENPAAKVDPLAQVFIVFITLSVMGMWVAASVAAATSTVSSSVLAFSLLAFVISVGVAFGTFGFAYMKSQLIKTPLGKAAFEFAGGDWGKGFVVVTLTPIVVGFFALNILQQLVRRFTCLGKHIEDEEERKKLLTKSVAKFWDDMQKWDWGSIYIKAQYWGILFFTVIVGVARLTTVFLSFLRLQLEAIDLGATVGIFVLVGIIMFLLPPVPGVPVYIAGGIIITSKTEDEFGFVGGLLFTLAICFGLKMSAITMQQKVIGEFFGSKSVYIRSLVSINSDTLKAMKIILNKPGLHFNKVVILIGGPDWPTSVLTGIMKLPLCQMLLGSVPVIFLIAPCVVSGAMLVKASEGGIYTSLNTISITLTFVVQSFSMLCALHFLAKKVKENKDEIDAMPNDEEVEERNRKTEAKRLLSKKLRSWAELNCVWKMGHRLTTAMMTVSCYMFQLLGKQIFVTFDITDTIEDKLGGNVVNLIVAPFGYLPLGMFALACLYLIIFVQIKGCQVNSEYKRTEEANGGSTEVALEI